MRPENLVLRCYAEYDADQWQVFCVDLCLAAQADSFDEAKSKLGSMICTYVYDALEGEDRKHASQLLSRKAPLRYRLKYRYYVVLNKVGAFKDGLHKLFIEPLPLVPAAKCKPA